MPIDDNWNQSKCICENGKYLKTILDNSKIEYDEIMYVMDIFPTNITTNSDDTKNNIWNGLIYFASFI